ncbi:Platelet-activating factor acetylhydrolase IB subunit gamma [Seminavis robusta]|uniref:Platelet-activating factor acetylhydrolase IB subunit gamma n=1 Tax=Seminavis robusta TaxID=568900 RepID=A0A9N8HH71_9STRA|nr:Platelet-activating factor acetylhydrolase IB subunit gamma [Seminavis robusta]|eukprot:Sro619_g176460.1 Platelet-activating factor acetylhydrolase IB subunit gamma (342) ;mRNA; f:36910-38127
MDSEDSCSMKDEPTSAPSSQSSYSRRAIVVVFALMGCAALVMRNTESFVESQEGVGAIEEVTETFTLTDSNSSLWKRQFCVEADDLKTETSFICKCTDPSLPLPRALHGEWIKYHWKMLIEVYREDHSNTLDVVLVGDSLIERWNGTQALGQGEKPAMRKAFESFFTKAGGGKLEGVALGTSADTSRNLLWHLKHGFLPSKTFFPKVWLILIGTNDLGGKHCSNQATLDGILQVAELIQTHRPTAQILVHGLLPRGDGPPEPHQLGKNWQRIQWINEQLQATCEERDRWHYMDSGDIFLSQDGTKVSKRIGDGIHPRVSGLKAWGPKIVEAVQKILSEDED